MLIAVQLHMMPLPVPPRALPAAHRVICMRAVRAFARGKDIEYGFGSDSSKKCCLVPLYVGWEYKELVEALDCRSAATGGGEEE